MATYFRQMSSFVGMGNPYRNMKRLAFATGIFLLAYTPAFTQQNWFVFIQSDNKQPFYARVDEKIYSSSSVGHLTIADLGDSTLKIVIGFPKNQYREQTFTIPVNRKDHGYLLKKDAGQDWVLYNWQTSNTVKSLQSVRGNSLLYGERKKNDAFADLMGAVVNDSAVLYTSVVRKPPPVKDTTTAVSDSTAVADKALAKADSIKKPAIIPDTAKTKKESLAGNVQNPPVADTLKNITAATPVPDTTVQVNNNIAQSSKPEVDSGKVISKTEEKKPAVTKLEEQTKDGDKTLVFLDGNSIKGDTVSIIIPAEDNNVEKPKTVDSQLVKKEPPPDAEAPVTKPKAIMSPPVTGMPVQKKDTVAVVAGNTESPKPDSAVVKTTVPKEEEKESVVLINSDCLDFATDNDVDKLRVKMLSAKTMGDRIFAAYKVLKIKCFTTKQVRGLSELFSTDESRYRFYETAYPYISDTARFKGLVDTFTDDFFITRFKTLVRM